MSGWAGRALLALTLLWVASMGLWATSARAQAPTQVPMQGNEVDPPGRVARLSDLEGQVWLYHPDNGDWVEAARNLPLTTGDTLATEAGARAELQIGSATLRLDSGSELEVVVLDDGRISLQLHAGVVAVRIRNAAETGPFDLSTEEGRFVVQSAGRYRFDRGTNSSFVGVDSGQVRYEYASSALPVNAGQRAEFWIDSNGVAQYGLVAPVYDAFTAWSNERDRVADRSVASRYVSPEMTGAQDLDRYGSWEQTPEYGAVWVPASVAVDWAPYSSGRWAWVQPWGWTWVDDAPWGFAPFHYGRWVNLRDRWCWTPGVREPRPVYAPALVGWIGGGRGGVSVSVGVGPAVGWFPLAPREVYVPGYRTSPRYARNINISNVTNVTSITAVFNNPQAPREFENRRFPRAVTVVPANVLTDRRPVGPAAAQFRAGQGGRDFAGRGGPALAVSAAPPVAAPPAPARQPEAQRPVRPPPGFVDNRGGRPAQPRPEPGGGRDAPREGGRPAASPPVPGTAPDPRTAQPVERDRSNRPDRPGSPNGNPNGNPGNGGTPAPAPGGPTAPPPQARPATAPDTPDSQRVRPLPVNRGDERRGDERRGDDRRGGDDRRPPVRTESVPARPQAAEPSAQPRPNEAPRAMDRAPAQPQPQPQPTSPPRPQERPQPARPEIVAPRAPEIQAPRVAPVQRPAEVAPPRAVEAPRPVPPPAEAPKPVAPEGRGERRVEQPAR